MDSPWDILYGAPFSAFVAERKRLAGELKRAGDTAGAKALAAAAKPSLSAWVVNQLWRAQRKKLERLFSLSEDVRTAKNAKKLRVASEALRSAIAGLREPANEILRSDGHAASETTWRRVGTTLSALAALGGFEPDEPGRLVADRDPPGFGSMEGLELERAPTPPRPPASAPPRPPPRAKDAPPPVDHAKKKALARARHALDMAQRARERAEKDVSEAQVALERAQEAESAAEREVAKYED